MMQDDGSKGDVPVKITIKDGKKPAEVFRTDLITAMKIPDHQLVTPGTYFNLNDPWKQEWEKGVQVPVNKESLPKPSFSVAKSNKISPAEFRMPHKLLKYGSKKENQRLQSYDLDDEDMEWLKTLNNSRKNKGLELLDELTMENAIGCLEDQCYTNMGETISTAKGLSIEYDEDIACDICRSPDCEEGNEILFCDVCDVAVHQACYGVQKVPIGSWVCKPCTQLLADSSCLLCSTRGGAMKKTKTKEGEGWVHMSCALWIPEVKIGNVEKMEPITRIETIIPGRWNLLCHICRERQGACIQCSVKSCVTAFHVTCGFDNGLHMQTVWDDSAPDGVKHVCYCTKHTEKRSCRSPCKSPSSIQTPPKSPKNSSPCTTPSKSSSTFRAQVQEERDNLRQNRLRGMEEEFYKYADIQDLAKDLNITKELATALYRYWTLKRKSREDAALLSPTAEQQELLSGRQIKPFQKATMEVERVVRLRQDLERIRNLCYMVEKREKMKRELTAAREVVFRKELEVVADVSGKMSLEDIQWARSCCVKNFTEYEVLQKLDLRCPEKPKIYKKRGRKPKRRIIKRNKDRYVPTASQADAAPTSEYSGECDRSELVNRSNEYAHGSSDVLSDDLDINDTTSAEELHMKKTSSRSNILPVNSVNNLSARPGFSRNECLSSDSDFEDGLARKERRRPSTRQLRRRKLSKSRRDAVGQTSDAESTPSLSPVPSKIILNGLNLSARVNLPEMKNELSRLCSITNNSADGHFKQKRKRLFSELSEECNEFESSRTPRSNVPSEHLNDNMKTVNEVFDTESNEEGINKPNSSCNRKSQSEEDGKLEVRFTRSRSRSSCPGSPKATPEKGEVLGTLQSDTNSVGLEVLRTRSTSTIPAINGVLCIAKNKEKNEKNMESHNSLSKDTNVSDVSSRTRSRSNTVDSSPVKNDIDVSNILTSQINESNFKQDVVVKEVIPKSCRTLRRQTRLSNDLGTSNGKLYSPSKCSRFFGKLRHAATTSA